MPHFRTEDLGFSDHERTTPLKVKVSINAEGEFYCDVPEALSLFFKPHSSFLAGHPEVRVAPVRGRKNKIISANYAALKNALTDARNKHLAPITEVEHVIRFNIESHVSFAVGEDGDVYPNCYYPGTKWPSGDEAKRYGGHHAQNPTKGGYSITVGARALTKITTIYGSTKEVEYKPYYKGESHLGTDNPAQKLNSWSSVYLSERAREIPYTDEAARFFYELMLGMARLSKMIQDQTFETSALLQTIERTTGLSLLESGSGKLAGFKVYEHEAHDKTKPA